MPTRPTQHRPVGWQSRDARRQEFDKQRNPEKAKRYDHAWRKLRRSFLLANPLCQPCLQQGFITAADQVHHHVDICDAPDRRLDWSNLVSICGPCHSRITAGRSLHRQQVAVVRDGDHQHQDDQD